MILKRHRAANEVKVWTFLGSPKFERENENLNHCATKLNPNGIIQTMPGQMKFISNLQITLSTKEREDNFSYFAEQNHLKRTCDFLILHFKGYKSGTQSKS